MSTLDAPFRVTTFTVPVPRVRRWQVLLTALALLAGLIASATMSATATGTGGTTISTGPAPSMEQQFLDLLNGERTRRGLKALTRVEGVNNVAREWSDTMAREQKLYHRPSMSNVFNGQWWKLGENVGVGYGPEALHKGFMDSPGHRANVLGDFDKVGVGVAIAGSRAWVTFNFVRGDASTLSKYRTNPITGYATGAGGGGPYYDIEGSTHASDIKALDADGLAVSCAGSRYCPDEPVRRADMAAILVAALELPLTSEAFTDVSSSHYYAGQIGALAKAGITMGCNPPSNDKFCPEELVTRQQMASFFVRALSLTTRTSPFRDVARTNVHAADIGGLASSDITRGCNPPTNDQYCPNAPITRGQMASFLARALSR